ncbi:hypothetical protein GCK32_019383 [Trichostrongylus colubriformis]|uniref:Uncharacterized protein n=1 Tax=Trichostrongylus colubriformis TaxID=6319 RepID=A0AAN8F0W6_TRICO
MPPTDPPMNQDVDRSFTMPRTDSPMNQDVDQFFTMPPTDPPTSTIQNLVQTRVPLSSDYDQDYHDMAVLGDMIVDELMKTTNPPHAMGLSREARDAAVELIREIERNYKRQ